MATSSVEVVRQVLEVKVSVSMSLHEAKALKRILARDECRDTDSLYTVVVDAVTDAEARMASDAA